MARSISSGNYLLNSSDTFDLRDGSSAYCFSAWIKPATVTGSTDFTVASRYPNAGHGALVRQITGKIRFFTIDSGGNGQEAIGVTSMVADTWNHVGGGWRGSGGGLAVYLNGVSDATTGTVTSSSTEPNTWGVGIRGDGTTPYSGVIAEVAWWKGVFLSDAEWLALAKGASPLTLRRDKIAAYWPIYGSASPEPDVARGAGTTPALSLTGSPTVANHAPVSAPPALVLAA